jgi:hypothetical protein
MQGDFSDANSGLAAVQQGLGCAQAAFFSAATARCMKSTKTRAISSS